MLQIMHSCYLARLRFRGISIHIPQEPCPANILIIAKNCPLMMKKLLIIRSSYNFFQRLLSLKAYGLRYSRDIHLEPKMPFCDIVSQVGCPNGSLSFPLGFSICPTDIQIGWVGVQMNVTRTIFPYLGHPERAGEQPPGFPKSPRLKVQSDFCGSHFSAN